MNDYCGLVTQKQAEHLAAIAADPETFAALYGIRTLARNEKMYNLSRYQ